MTRPQISLLSAIFIVAVLARALSLPTVPFFCDVPTSVAAVNTGKMYIQFPGYVPFHWTIRVIGWVFGGPFHGAVAFSLACGMAAMVYCTRFAYDRGGYPAALLTAAFMGFSPISIYFSCVGASYTTDLLGVSAILFHGNRFIDTREDGQFRRVVLWFIFGCLMRTLSFWFLGLGVVFLLWKYPSRKNLVFTIVSSVLGAALFWIPTLYYYGDSGTLRHALIAPTGAGFHGFGSLWLVENEVRNVLFLLWSMNVFVFVIIAVVWMARRHLNRPLTTFFILLTLPYFCFLLWYNCHAGYVCLLLPAFACAPWLADRPTWPGNRALALAALFGIISFVQFFGARPVYFRGISSLVENTYLFTYTNQGIKAGMFANLQQWSQWTHIKVSNTATAL
jgi:hypothetical protein